MHTLPRIFRFCTLAPLWGAKLACAPVFAISILQISLIFNNLQLSLLYKVKPYGFTCSLPHMGIHTRAWAGRDTPKINPIFYENCPYTQTPIRTQLATTVRP